jgi:hypothetical protein
MVILTHDRFYEIRLTPFSDKPHLVKGSPGYQIEVAQLLYRIVNSLLPFVELFRVAKIELLALQWGCR